MPKISPLGQKLWPTGRGQTQKRPKTAKNDLKIAISRSNLKISKNKKMCFEWCTQGSFMPKISTLGQKLWPTGFFINPKTPQKSYF